MCPHTRNYIASTNTHSITNNVNTTNTANTIRFISQLQHHLGRKHRYHTPSLFNQRSLAL